MVNDNIVMEYHFRRNSIITINISACESRIRRHGMRFQSICSPSSIDQSRCSGLQWWTVGVESKSGEGHPPKYDLKAIDYHLITWQDSHSKLVKYGWFRMVANPTNNPQALHSTGTIMAALQQPYGHHLNNACFHRLCCGMSESALRSPPQRIRTKSISDFG